MKKSVLSCFLGLAISTSVPAAEIYLDNLDPAPFRLQTYTSATGEVIAVWFTTSLCANQLLSFPSTVPSEKNRFWNTILAAKLAKKKLFISYDHNVTAGTCVINSYAVKEE